MQANKRRYQKKIKAAYLIYKERMPLQDVAKTLGISRPTLSKMIDEILKEEIVSIQIKDPENLSKYIDLGYQIKKRYKLRDAIVVEAVSAADNDITESIGFAGASYLQDFLHSGITIGTTGGKTIYALVSHLVADQSFSDINVITTTGGSLYANTRYHSNTIAQRLADLYNGQGYFIYAPSYADNLEQKETLLQNSQIRRTLELCKSVDIALTGIGNADIAFSYLPHPVEQWFQENPVSQLAGAINTLLIDKRGRPFPSPVSELSIGLNYDDLRNIDMVIALAGGAQKHTAIRSALLGGYLDVLITDQYTATYLLEQ